MKIEKTVNGSSAVLRLDGWLDTNNSKMLADASEELDESIKELELDFEKLEYISSSGVRQVVALYKRMERLTITHVSEEIRDVFRMTGLDKRLNIL